MLLTASVMRCRPKSVFRVVGNAMVDALFSQLGGLVPDPAIMSEGGACLAARQCTDRPTSAIPMRSSGLSLQFRGFRRFMPILWPMHPRTRAGHWLANLSCPMRSRLTRSAWIHLDFIATQSRAQFVLTDSGGVQETTALDPCLTLRDNTERPITVTEGTNRLVGSDRFYNHRCSPRLVINPPELGAPSLWDGRAADRCAEAIEELLHSSNWPNPTDLY